MPVRHHEFSVQTTKRNLVVDVTSEVAEVVHIAGVQDGVCTVFTPHATAAIAINESEDPNVGIDTLRALARIIPDHEGWYHDKVDNNGAAHIKAAIIGPSESIPIVAGKLALGRWQNVLFIELDGPKPSRRIIVTITS